MASVAFDRPEAWTTALGDRLQEVAVDAPLGPLIAQPVTERVQRFGFALVRSSACALDPDSVGARTDDLGAFGAALGTPIVQSPRRELIEAIRDFSDVDERDDRGYRSAGELAPHSDPPTLIVLHCLQPARVGGETSLVSVAAIVERMARTDPALVDVLCNDLPAWRVEGQYGIADAGAGDPHPVLALHEGVLSCVLYRPFIEQAAEASGRRLTDPQREALDRFDECASAPDLRLRFTLWPGETLVLHNRSVLHARTHYDDWPDPHRRRHLLRMWIDAPDRFPVHPGHELGDFFAPREVSRSPS